MNKEELIRKVTYDGISIATTERIINRMLDVVTEELKDGKTVSIYGFGKLKTVECKSKRGRNWGTKKPMEIPSHRTVKFIPGNALKNKLNKTGGK